MSDPAIIRQLAERVPMGSRVLDLGCGDGALLAYLQQHRACTGYGVELDDANVLACVRRGVSVLQLNLDQGLSLFADQSFDVVLQIDTLQHLRNAETMLQETARVGRLGIVAFPNFAHWPNRLSILKGRMPVSESLPYQWFDTPNVRFFTIADFEALCAEQGIVILETIALDNGARVTEDINFLADTAIYRLGRA